MAAKANEITRYFPVTKQTVWVPVENVESTTEKFYKGCLIERENEVNCIEQNCASKKLELMNRLKDEKEKLANLEKSLLSCNFIIEEKNKKIAQLQGKLCASNKADPISNTKSIISPKTPHHGFRRSFSKTPTSPIFKNHEKYLSTQQLAQLRSFDRTMRDDSRFILLLMRSLYEHDLNELKSMKCIRKFYPIVCYK